MEKQHPHGEKDPVKPAILLFSPRERMGDILNVALMQWNYQIINSNTSFLAMIKANQFLPDLIIADITPNNTKDTLLITRLQKSLRTRKIPILVVTPGSTKHYIETVIQELGADVGEGGIHLLEYPFNFSDLLNKVGSLMPTINGKTPSAGPPRIGMSDSDKTIAPKLYDPNYPLESKLKAVESSMRRQWAFPFTIIKALDIIGSDSSCCNELARCIEADPAASAAILKVANAVYYAKRSSRVTEVKEAVVRLGFRETYNLLTCLALIDLKPQKKAGVSRDDFWMHSLGVALIAEKISKDWGHIKPELGFIAGLLHDLGKIPLDNNFDTVFPHLLGETAASGMPFYKTELRLLGFSHAELGHFLTTKWNFPATVSMAILNHHKPNLILETSTPMEKILQEAVFMADILAKAMGIGHSCDEILEEVPLEILRDLHLLNGPTETFFSQIYRDLSIRCKYLGITSNSLSIVKARPDGHPTNIIAVHEKKICYYPLFTALRNNGFTVRATPQFTPELYNQAQIIVFIPDKGFPPDIMSYIDDNENNRKSPTLTMVLLDAVSFKNAPLTQNADALFFDRTNLDLHNVLAAIDRFLGAAVTPENAESEFIYP